VEVGVAVAAKTLPSHQTWKRSVLKDIMSFLWLLQLHIFLYSLGGVG